MVKLTHNRLAPINALFNLCYSIIDFINRINALVLVLYVDDDGHPVAEDCLQIIKQSSNIVDHLYRRGKTLGTMMF